MDKIILIGGAPVSGKSYAAKKIAESLKLPWISTDTIREQMRKIVNKKDYPKLFLHSDPSLVAAEYLSKHSVGEIVKNQNSESVDVWRGVRAMIDTDYVWGSFIIEGVAILPKFVKRLSIKNKKVRAVFLVDDNIKRIRKIIFTRGLWDDAEKYPDEVKEKEIEWVIAFNKYITKEARKYGFPVIKIENRKDHINKIKKLLSKT